jgi:hypothetical protein
LGRGGAFIIGLDIFVGGIEMEGDRALGKIRSRIENFGHRASPMVNGSLGLWGKMEGSIVANINDNARKTAT